MSKEADGCTFSTRGKPLGGSSDDEEDDVIYFNSQMNNITFVSDDDEASGKVGRSPIGPKRIPAGGHAAVSRDPATVQVNYGSLPLLSHGAPVLALSPDALQSGFPGGGQGGGVHSSIPTAQGAIPGSLGASRRGSGNPAGSFARFQVRDGQADSPHPPHHQHHQHQPQSNSNLPSMMTVGSPHSLPGVEMNIYTGIMNPPTNGVPLEFRRYYEDDEELAPLASIKSPKELIEMEAIPQSIRSEESAGIFMGQLPASYTESDIKLLLKSLAKLSNFPIECSEDEAAGGAKPKKRFVEVREVKSHARDKTCAFIMINASSLLPILDFSKRVLCDVQCVYVCDSDKKNEINHFISRHPREMLKGVPKAALVLEKLTPQGKNNGNHAKGQQQHQQPNLMSQQPPMMGMAGQGMNPGFVFGGMPGGVGFLPSPMGGCAPNPAAPAFVPTSMLGGGGGLFLSPGGGMGPGATMAFAQQQQQQHQQFNMLSLAAFQNPLSPSAAAAAGGLGGLRGPASPLLGSSPNFASNSVNLNLQSYLGHSNSIASMEAANQALIAASRSRQNSIASNDANKSAGSPGPASAHASHQDTTDGNGISFSPGTLTGHLQAAKTSNQEDGEASPSASAPPAARVQPISLPSTLEGIKCSCGCELVMSQVPDAATVADDPITCEVCKKAIDGNMVICYTCPWAHIFVCSLCSLKHAQRLREKQDRLAQQQAAKPKFTLIGLEDTALDPEARGGEDTPAVPAVNDGRGTAN